MTTELGLPKGFQRNVTWWYRVSQQSWVIRRNSDRKAQPKVSKLV